jgi:hypothetical protein
VLAGLLLPQAAWAQSAPEWRVQALGLVAPDPFAAVGAGAVLRGRTGLAVGGTGVLGLQSNRLAARGEALLSFSLDPLRERGPTPYVAGGVAVQGDETGTREFLVAVLGLSVNPGARRGWFVEAGVGGGVRLSLGIAFRRIRR